MAKRKRKAAVSRKRVYKAAPKRRRRRTARKGGLSELFTPAVAAQTGKTVGLGALGGIGALAIDRLTPNSTPMQKGIYMGVAAFITGSVLRSPAAAAGMAGVAAMKLLEGSNFLSEGNSIEWAEPIESLPPFIADENSYSLGDQYALADAFQLAQTMSPSIYPAMVPFTN